MVDLTLHHTICHALRSERESRERWMSLRELLNQILRLTEPEADEILRMAEISSVVELLRDEFAEWTATIEADWASIRWRLDPALRARSDASYNWKQAVQMLSQQLQCGQHYANEILHFLESSASNGLFQVVAQRWANTLDINWSQLIFAATGHESKLTADLRIAAGFGKSLLNARQLRSLSLENLARLAGLPEDRIRQFEDGLEEPLLAEILKCAAALSMQSSELLQYIDGVTPDAPNS